MDVGLFETKNACDKGAECTIIHPITGPTEVKIRLVGQHGEVHRAAFSRMRLARQAVDSPNDEQLGAEFLADITLGWSGIQRDGKELKFTRENAVWLYSNFEIVNNQVYAFATDLRNFMRAS